MTNIDDWADTYIRNGVIGGKQIVPIDPPENVDPMSLTMSLMSGQLRTQAFEFHRANWSDWLTFRYLSKVDLVKLRVKTYQIYKGSDCNVNNKVYIEQMLRMISELINSKASKKVYRSERSDLRNKESLNIEVKTQTYMRPNSKRNLS